MCYIILWHAIVLVCNNDDVARYQCFFVNIIYKTIYLNYAI